MFGRPSPPLGFDPRGRSPLIAEQFRDAPDMIRESCCHGWCTRTPAMGCLAQLLVRDAEVIRTSNQIHSCLKCFQTMSRVTTFTGQRGQTFPRSEEHTSELQSQSNLVCSLLLAKQNE